MRKARITQKAIAEKLGISISTVSRALSGAKKVDPVLRAKILELASQGGYSPNRQALGLLNQQTNTLGIIIPEIESPYFSSILNGIEHEANLNDFLIIAIYSNDSQEKEQKALNELLSYNVDGIAISPALETTNLKQFQKLIDNGFPLLFFDRIFEELDVPKIVVNNREITYKATRHLIEQGYKKIAILSCTDKISMGRDRVFGYMDALKEFKLPIQDEYIVHDYLTLQSGIEGTKKLLSKSNKPDAIICLNDLMAAGAMGIIAENGMNIPNEIGIMGFSDAQFSPYLKPSLTTISHPTFEMGRMAVRKLIQQITSGEILNTTTTLNAELVVRESTKFNS